MSGAAHPPSATVAGCEPLLSGLLLAAPASGFSISSEPGNPAYNIPGGLRVERDRSTSPVFAAAVNEIVRRAREALRTRLEPPAPGDSDGEPVQVIARALRLAVPVVDLRRLLRGGPLAAEAEKLGRLIQRLPFDLARGPLLPASACCGLEAENHRALFTLHHSIADGWSVSLFLREIFLLYSGVRRRPGRRRCPSCRCTMRTTRFLGRQRGRVQGEVLAEHCDWWREQLAGAPPLLALPATTIPGRHCRPSAAASVPVVFAPDVVRSLRTLGRGEGASLFMVLLAGWQALLSPLQLARTTSRWAPTPAAAGAPSSKG